jgi:hypothetical protein
MAGAVGWLFGIGLIAGCICGMTWGFVQYITGDPNPMYGETYLTKY